MRNRIAISKDDGRVYRIFRRRDFWGQKISSEFVTSETPEHAMSSIKKMKAFKHKLLHKELNVRTPQMRKNLFYSMTKTQYRAAIGL